MLWTHGYTDGTCHQLSHKSKTMTLNPAPGHPESVFTLRGVNLQAVQTFKYLGMYFHHGCFFCFWRANGQSSRHVAAGPAMLLACSYWPASIRMGLDYVFVYTHAPYGAEAWAAPRNDKMDAICKAALGLVFGLHQFEYHADILFADSGLLPVRALIFAAKLCGKVRLSNMSAEPFPVAVDCITIPGRIDAACKKAEDSMLTSTLSTTMYVTSIA